MLYRQVNEEDIASVLELQGCTDQVIFAACRSVDTVQMFLRHRPFSRVAIAYESEYQFFEKHVLQYQVPFIDFYNGLLDRVEIRGLLLETHEEEPSEVVLEENDGDADDEGEDDEEEEKNEEGEKDSSS